MNIQIDSPRTKQLPPHVNGYVSNLMALTGGHLSGILICDEMVTVADWEGRNGLPYFSFSYSITFIEPEMVTLTDCYHTDDIRLELPGRILADQAGHPVEDGMEILHDNCGDIPRLFGFSEAEDGSLMLSDRDGVTPGQPGMCYRLSAKGESLLVISPDSWI